NSCTGSCARSSRGGRRDTRQDCRAACIRWAHDRRSGACARRIAVNGQTRLAHREGVAQARARTRASLMNDERWARVKALFQPAGERPAAERDAFLAAATADDETVRREVESLLASDAAYVAVVDEWSIADGDVRAGLLGTPIASVGETPAV